MKNPSNKINAFDILLTHARRDLTIEILPVGFGEYVDKEFTLNNLRLDLFSKKDNRNMSRAEKIKEYLDNIFINSWALRNRAVDFVTALKFTGEETLQSLAEINEQAFSEIPSVSNPNFKQKLGDARLTRMKYDIFKIMRSDGSDTIPRRERCTLDD
jgi:hypothetical protein